jgi:serine/threonine protein kinase
MNDQHFPDRPATAGLETLAVEHQAAPPPRAAGYEVLGEVGKGGMGVVYEAREERLGRVVALKMPKAGGDDHRRFVAEARIAAALEHPGIVPVHELVTPNGGDPFYTMKLVRGRRLDEAIQAFHANQSSPSGREVERRRLLEACLAVTRTMAFAHTRGVIHRDLKPANVILGEFGETVILDWGLAKHVRTAEAGTGNPDVNPSGPTPTGLSTFRVPDSEMTAAGAVLGTPAYMAPEQAAGTIDEVDERSDVYGLGAILYHVLTNAPPHRADSAFELLRMVREDEPVRPRAIDRHIPRPLEAVCLRAMAKGRDARYPAAADLARDLERFLAGEPVSAYRERRGERFARWSRRHRTLVATVAVTLVLSAIGTAAGLYLREKAEGERREREFEKARDEQDRRSAVERAAAADEALGQAKFRAARFDEAEQLLARAVETARSSDGLDAVASRIGRERDDARRLADFYRLKDRADGLAAMTSLAGSPTDAEVVTNIELALRRVNVVGGPPDRWWERLPGRDQLPHELRRRVEEDTAAAIGLLGLWHAKKAMLNLITPPAVVKQSRACIDMIQAYDRHHGRELAASGQVLNLFLSAALGEKLPAKRPGLEPRTAADHYFLGVTHLMLAETETTDAATRTMVAVMRARYGEAFRLSGLEITGHRLRAELLFRRAVALEPTHFWAHFSLGQTLVGFGDWGGAEQAMNTCVALRPDYLPAHHGRNEMLLTAHSRSQDTVEALERFTWPPLPHRLWPGPHGALAQMTSMGVVQVYYARRRTQARRCLDGVRAAPSAIRLDPAIRWRTFHAMTWAGDAGFLEPAATAVEMLLIEKWADLPPSVYAPSMRKTAWTELITLWGEAKDPLARREYEAALAVAYLAADKPLADVVAKRVLDADPGHARALAAHGVWHFQAGRLKEAATDFDRALARQPNNELAAVGRALVAEKQGEWAAALAGFDHVLKVAGVADAPSNLHLLGHLGRARALATLARPDDARKALDAAAANNSLAAETLAAALFPPAKP